MQGKEYLSSREKKVVDMLIELYDEQEMSRSYVESEKYEVENAAKIATARRLLKIKKLSVGEIVE